MTRVPSVAIVGMGHVGRGLARAFSVAKIRRVTHLRADIVLLTVRDDQIPEAAREVSKRLAQGAVVLHTSGIVGCDALKPLAGRGFALGSMHPLLSFANPRRAADRIATATFALAGDRRAVSAARKLVRALGARVVTLCDADKPLYHAAAVFAANYLVANLAIACELLARIGIDERSARRLVTPLALGALENVSARGAARALSGPIARGDDATVRAHLAALPLASYRRLYAALGRVVLEIADIPPPKRARLRAILKGGVRAL